MVFEPERCLIPRLLREIGKNQQWLAEQTGYSAQRISDYCNLRYIMGMEVAKSISHIIGCTIDDLYTWKIRD
ncbi:helix-turn-helix domain-containing protein [Paenibacillus lutrae]|uniref:Helix-turn-helix domain-containing protein n=1 Tax=Paenibacillus lutrae TaxID=2078573 RepID=A0A7X3FJD0_9BACL|nr:helix-turn-helix domain-containing protein [Paenibacillus lutrae]